MQQLQLVSGLGEIALGHGRRFLRVLELRSGQHTAVGQLFVPLEPGARVLELVLRSVDRRARELDGVPGCPGFQHCELGPGLLNLCLRFLQFHAGLAVRQAGDHVARANLISLRDDDRLDEAVDL